MTDLEIRTKSAAKMKQIFDLMKLLQIEPDAVQKLDNQGVLRHVVLWTDVEVYPKPTPAPTTPTDTLADAIGEAPTGETHA